VETAHQMFEATSLYFSKSDIVILAAAVADYRPKTIAEAKIKKKSEDLQIDLEKTTDIAATLGQQKRKGQVIVGFALETNNELANAIGKRKRKNFDFIVLNSLKDKGAGFNHDTNKITIIGPDNSPKEFDLKSKSAVAQDIIDELTTLL